MGWKMRIKDHVHRRVIELRAIERLVETEKFQRVWATANDLSKARFLDHVNACNRYECFKWYDAQVASEIDSLRIQDLRILAKRQGISRYHHLDRATLLMELKKNVS